MLLLPSKATLYQLLIGDVRRPLTADWSAAVSDPLLREDLHECLKWDPNQRFNAAASLSERLRHHPKRKEQLRQQELAGRSAARRRVRASAEWLV